MIYDLVSVVIITYNSSQYVCETLDSIYNQDYNNIEVIISDDSSKDNTIEVVKEWLDKNGHRFVRSEIVTTPFNTGLPANCNRGIRASSGEWVKILAGDDLLMSNCISTYMSFVQSHPDNKVLFARSKPFRAIGNDKTYLTSVPSDDKLDYITKFNESSAHEQFRILLRDGCFIQAPTVFAQTSFLKDNPYPEKYKFEEDYPMWLKLTKQGSRLYILFKETVMYRKDNSLSRRKNDYYSRCYMSTRELLFWNECLDYFKQENLPDAYARYRKVLLRYELTEAFLQNRKNKFNSVILKIFDFFINRFAKYEL